MNEDTWWLVCERLDLTSLVALSGVSKTLNAVAHRQHRRTVAVLVPCDLTRTAADAWPNLYLLSTTWTEQLGPFLACHYNDTHAAASGHVGSGRGDDHAPQLFRSLQELDRLAHQADTQAESTKCVEIVNELLHPGSLQDKVLLIDLAFFEKVEKVQKQLVVDSEDLEDKRCDFMDQASYSPSGADEDYNIALSDEVGNMMEMAEQLDNVREHLFYVMDGLKKGSVDHDARYPAVPMLVQCKRNNVF